MTEELAKNTPSNASSDNENTEREVADIQIQKAVDGLKHLLRLGEDMRKQLPADAIESVKHLQDAVDHIGRDVREKAPVIAKDIYERTKQFILDQGEAWQDHNNSFDVFADKNFKLHCVLISQLLSEVWLGTEKGEKFQKDINGVNLKEEDDGTRRRFTLVEALNRAGIETIKDYVDYELDTSTYNGSLVPKEILDEGLHFVWYIPYAPCPGGKSMNIDEVEVWVRQQIPQWIEEHQEDPSVGFPVPPNPYIPLATT